MLRLFAFLRRLLGVFRKRRHEASMAAEMQAHLDALTERNRAAGMSPEDARFAALRAFGGVEQIKERARDERSFIWLDQIFQDLRYAVRQLRRSSGFTAVAVLSLAIGIGAGTASFSLVDAVLLRSLPVEKPDELVLFRWVCETPSFNGIQGYPTVDKASGHSTSPFFSYLAFERFRANSTALADVFAFTPLSATIVVKNRTLNTHCALVTGNYFKGLGIGAMRGRMLNPDDDQADAAPAAVISHAFCQEHFGGADEAIGKTIRINQVAFTIVGVMPRGFVGAGEFGEAPAIMLPMAIMPRLDGDLGFLRRPLIWWVNIMGRLRPGIRATAAEAELAPILALATEEASLMGEPGTPGKKLSKNNLPRLQLDSGAQGLTDTRRALARPLFLLGCIVGGVLLLTCLNLANLLLARLLVRRREIALRLSLGAGRGRILRQLLTESLLLSLLGGSLGLLVARWGLDALFLVWPVADRSFTLDLSVLTFALGLSFLTALLFGIGPAWQATRSNLDTALKARSVGFTGTTHTGFRGALMIAQVAISVVLFTGTGLFLRTLHNFATLNVGFDRDHLIYFGVDPGASHVGPEQQADLYHRLQGELDRLPGVMSVALVERPLLSGSRAGTRILLPQGKLPIGQKMQASVNSVSASFFHAMGIPLILGRTFTASEMEADRHVAVVNETFGRAFFPGENPIGRSFGLPGSTVFHTPDRQVEIIGVAADAHYADLRANVEPTYYVPLLDETNATFVVRTAGDPHSLFSSLQTTLQLLAADATLRDVRTQQQTVDRLLSSERLFTLLCGAFSVVALTLTCLGLFGLLAHDVTARTREIGIRVALGARLSTVSALVIGRGMKLVVAGLAIGIAAAVVLTRFISALLFNVSPFDPFTFIGVGIALTAVAFLACWLPARRATKVDPMVALRCE